jgi:DNA-binding PadR family transcriptional regulator
MELSSFGRYSDPALLILTSLVSEARHGYAIIEDVKSFSGVCLGPGTLYGALARLEQRGLIEALPPEERRHPYRLTTAGGLLLREHLHNLQQIAETGLRRLGVSVA